MIELTTFQHNLEEDYNDNTLRSAIIEINTLIKQHAFDFRILIKFKSDSIESKLYKNALTGYFISTGFKIVNFDEFIYIDWGNPTVHITALIDSKIVNRIEWLGNYFKAEDLYLIITSNNDMSLVSYRVIKHYVKNSLKNTNKNTDVISLCLSTTLTADVMNSLFAPTLLKLSYDFPTTHLTFLDGGLFQITKGKLPEKYTNIPYEVLFGTKYKFD